MGKLKTLPRDIQLTSPLQYQLLQKTYVSLLTVPKYQYLWYGHSNTLKIIEENVLNEGIPWWVRTQHFNCSGLGSLPGREAKIPQSTWCGQKKKCIKWNCIMQFLPPILNETMGKPWEKTTIKSSPPSHIKKKSSRTKTK